MTHIRQGAIQEAHTAFMNIPELDRYLTLDEMTSRLPKGAIILVATVPDTRNAIDIIVGFKIGYPINEQHFYSWLGGVIPEYRGNGIAQQLLAEQERRVAERGYTLLSVKSMNRFPGMLCLLIKNGYQITNVSHHGDEHRERIHFSKPLHSTVQ